MDVRPLGRSGLRTPPLVFGGNVFGWTLNTDQTCAILDEFVDRGGVMNDTADYYAAWMPGYKGGESETAIGEWLIRSGRRNDVLIATKVGFLDGEGGSGLKASRIAGAVDESLRRLRTDVIDLYFAHRDDQDVPLEESLAAFDKLVKAGKVRALGASGFSAPRLAQALKISQEHGWVRFSVLQPLYNLVERGAFEGPLQALCIKEEIGVIPYFGLASGYLTGKYRSRADLEGSARRGFVQRYVDGGGEKVLAVMDAIAAQTGANLASIAIAWLAAQPGITAPIASATSSRQLADLFGGIELRLTSEQLAVLSAASA